MAGNEKKIRKNRTERLSKLTSATRGNLNQTEWQHRVTDSADYNGTQKIPGNSGDYEITTDYRRIPAKKE